MDIKIHVPDQNKLYHYKLPNLQYIFINGSKVLLHFICSGWLTPTLKLPILTTHQLLLKWFLI